MTATWVLLLIVEAAWTPMVFWMTGYGRRPPLTRAAQKAVMDRLRNHKLEKSQQQEFIRASTICYHRSRSYHAGHTSSCPL